MKGRQSVLLLTPCLQQWRATSLCFTISSEECHRCTRHWVGAGFLRWNGLSTEWFSSPQIWLKLLNAAVCVGQSVGLVVCCFALLTLVSDWWHRKCSQYIWHPSHKANCFVFAIASFLNMDYKETLSWCCIPLKVDFCLFLSGNIKCQNIQ